MKIKVVLVGCGAITNAWFAATKNRDDVEYAGLVDLKEEAARRAAEKHNLATAAIGTDLDAMLAQTKPDVVFNCTVPEAHAPVTLAALKRGCHVLEEKPLADSMANARKMVAAADKAGRLFAVIQNRRYNPHIRRLRAFLASGAIGRITTVNCDFYVGARFGGFRAEMDHVLLLDMAIHSFDQARLISASDPLAVYCREWNPSGSWYRHGASAVAVFEMTDDIVFTYRGSWCPEGLNTPWECEWRIVGDKGTAIWDGKDGIRAQVTKDNGKLIWDGVDCAIPAIPDVAAANQPVGHAGVIDEFLRCVKEGGSPETAAKDNIKSLAMVFGAIDSAATGRRKQIVERPRVERKG